jgi:DNA-binding GntR family transcriptional regulator
MIRPSTLENLDCMSSSAASRPTPQSTPVVRELFKNRAYDELRARLFNNQYEPGAYLSERQLAAELGMSKTPVKAALERLEQEGFITVSPQSGIVVRELSDVEVAEIYEVRMALEGYVLRTVAGGPIAELIKRWESNLKALKEVAEQPNNRQQVVALDTEFHALPSELLGNQQLIRMMQQISDKIRIVTHNVFTLLPHRTPQSWQEHFEIVAAMRSGDGQRASDLMEAHIRRGYELLVKARKQCAQVD